MGMRRPFKKYKVVLSCVGFVRALSEEHAEEVVRGLCGDIGNVGFDMTIEVDEQR